MSSTTLLAADLWFSGAAADELYTTADNWWPFDDDGDPCTPDITRAPVDGDNVGHDAAAATMLIEFPMILNPAQLMIGDWGPGPNGVATMRMTGGIVNVTGDFGMGMKPYEDWGNPDWANYGNGRVNLEGGNLTVGGNLIVGEQGIGQLNLIGGVLQAEALLMGIVDPDIALNGFGDYDNLLNITDGKMILAGNISTLDPRVIAFGGTGSLVFGYEDDLAGYTSITAEIPEPITLTLLGLGCLFVRKR